MRGHWFFATQHTKARNKRSGPAHNRQTRAKVENLQYNSGSERLGASNFLTLRDVCLGQPMFWEPLLFHFFEPVLVIHCQTALDLGEDVEQPLKTLNSHCLAIRKRQATHSMVRSTGWTETDNMFNSHLLYATLLLRG